MRLYMLLLSLLLCMLLDSVRSQDWIRHTVLDGDGRYHLYWNPPEDKRGDSKISFRVELRAKGYFGFGLSPNGGMPGSDIVTGWIKDGEVFFQDRHATAFSLPPRDDQQDYEVITAFENDTFTVFEFRRKLDTCDEDDMVIDDSTMRVIYAYSEEDPEGEDPFYHGQNRGSKSIMLLQSEVNSGVDLDFSSLLQWDIRSPDIDISEFDTLYWCKIFNTPEISEKHHIVYVEPLLQEGHEQFVHHILLYECVGGTPEEYDDFLDYRGHECNHPNMPVEMTKCEGVTIGWAVGGEDIVLPAHVGLPLYPPPGRYFMFEVHYDNPQLQAGIIDHSGLRIYYTPDLREYDAGSFMIGSAILPRVFIPPRLEEYIVVGHSNPDCLAPVFPETGVKGIAILLHAHIISRGIKVRHFRENTELVPLAEDRNYDFNYQEYRFYSEEIDFLPHDQITVECNYNSSERSRVTLGGQSTREEMCVAFLLYYPLVPRYASLSVPTFDTINKVLNLNLTQEADIYDGLGNYDWTTVDIDQVQHAMRYSEHNTVCYFGDDQKDGVTSLISYPSDFIPYIRESTCNDSTSRNGSI